MIARLSAITALAAASLLLAPMSVQAATAPGEVVQAASASTTVTATSTGWSHTISGMAAHVCGRSTPALWRQIARDNRIADPDRIQLGQTIAVRCAGAAAVQATPAQQPQTHATTPPATGSTARDARIAKVIHYARAQIGKWYRFGSAGPNTFDCSGLIVAAYHRIGITLPHQSGALHYRGRAINSRAQLRPGDVVFLRRQSGTRGHVALYLGNGLVVEAPHSGARVRINRLYAFYGGRRII